LPYLWRTLALPIHELNDLGSGDASLTPQSTKYETAVIGMSSIMSPSSMEVDPNKMDEGSDASVNILQLMLISQKLFAAIARSVNSIPPQLRMIYGHIRKEVERKFPDHVYKSVAGFLFLRFICPSILAPHVYGLLNEPPNQDCQRYLILLSKTLQNLALGTLPGRKEEYMEKMNEFITSNQDLLHKFIDEVTQPVDISDVEPTELPRGLESNSLAYLHHHMITNLPALKRHCDEQPYGQELREKFVILDKLGPPLTPKQP